MKMLGLLLGLGLLAGCGSDGDERPAYLDAQSGPGLVVREGGAPVAGNGQYAIPGLEAHQAPAEALEVAPPTIVSQAEEAQDQNEAPASRFESELRQDAQGTPFLVVKGEYEAIWTQLLQALKRTGFNIESIDPQRGHILLQVRDRDDKKHPVKTVRLVVARGYQSARILIQNAEQPTPAPAPLAKRILNIIRTSL